MSAEGGLRCGLWGGRGADLPGLERPWVTVSGFVVQAKASVALCLLQSQHLIHVCS